MNNSVTYVIELHLPAGSLAGLDIVRAALIGAGFDATGIVESMVKKQPRLSLYFHNKNLFGKALKRIKMLDLKGVRVRSRDLQVVQWRDKWKKDFKAFQLTGMFDVVPAWDKDRKRRSARLPILLDTGLAFGTGLHETTRFMVELIETKTGGARSFFDIGTGTGILAIAAAKMGVASVDAIDISRDAVKVAKQNLRANGIKNVTVRSADISRLPATFKYDYVAANLITPDLISFKRKILSFVKPGGYLAVSGISLEKLSELRRAFKELPLKCVKLKKGESWSAILYERAKRTR